MATWHVLPCGGTPVHFSRGKLCHWHSVHQTGVAPSEQRGMAFPAHCAYCCAGVAGRITVKHRGQQPRMPTKVHCLRGRAPRGTQAGAEASRPLCGCDEALTIEASRER